MVDVSVLPDYLRLKGRFCCWHYEDRDGKKTKVPINPRTGHKAQSNNPDTFSDLATARAGHTGTKGAYGIGLGLFPPLVGIDIDHCVEDGKLSELARDIVNTMDSYTEYSPSGTGVHIICAARDFQYRKDLYYIKNDRIGLEVYVGGQTERYLTVTGNEILHRQIADKSEQLQIILDKYMKRPEKPKAAARTPQPVSLDDAELLELAARSKSGEKFKQLWSGDMSGYDSHSNADQALCNMLAFWTGRDAGRMDRMFRASGLMRSKWDERRGAQTYGQMTIEKAISNCGEVYTHPGEGHALTLDDKTPPEWDPPIPFNDMEIPAFPTECLPHQVERMVEALAESTQTPEAMAGILSLAVLSTLFQSRYEVLVTPDWIEPLSLFCVAVAAPAERKSAVISALTRPIYSYEEKIKAERAAEIEQNRTEKDILEKRRDAAKAAAAKGTKDAMDQYRREALELSNQLANFEEKHELRLLADDTTPEKLVELMERQNGNITVCSSEGGIFDLMQGRYDRGVNIDVYLKGHAADPIHVDRVGRKGNYIAKPHLTMMLTIQPEVLNGLIGNTTFKGRGLCGRFLYAVCDSKIGVREPDSEPIPAEVKRDYSSFIDRALSNDDSGVITLSQEAQALRREYQMEVEKMLGDRWENMRDWGGKIVGAVVRIAALLHCATYSPAQPIRGETMEAAIKIGYYLGSNAESVYANMGADQTAADAKYLLKKILMFGEIEIRKAELHARCRGHFKTASDMAPALDLLEEHNYIALEKRTTGRRPLEYVMVNPAAFNT